MRWALLCWVLVVGMLRSVTCLARKGSWRIVPVPIIKEPIDMRTRVIGNPITMDLKNSQRTVPVDMDRFSKDLEIIRKILRVEDFQLSVWVCGPNTMRDYNKSSRNKSKVTDVLAFQHYDFAAPEVVADKSQLDIAMFLGDIMVAPSYINKVAKRDEELFLEDPELLELESDRGVSKEIATIFNVQERLPLLTIHSILHLMGYDHETERDWEIMTSREQEVIDAFRAARKLEGPLGGLTN